MAQPGKPRNGRLRIPLPFEEAVRAALETRGGIGAGEPPAVKAKKKRTQKRKT